MTPKTVLALIASLGALALVGCGDDNPSTIVIPDVVVDTVPPAVPSNVEVRPLTASVELTWTENSEPDLAGYVLERSLDEGATWHTVGEELLTTAGYSDTKNRSASYRVAAKDLSDNQSAFSSEVSYRIPTPKPKYGSLPDTPL